jgi:hypothetical protein
MTRQNNYLAGGLIALASALSAPSLEFRKPTREEIARREYQPEPKKPMTKEQERKRAQAKAARKARSKQHSINKNR